MAEPTDSPIEQEDILSPMVQTTRVPPSGLRTEYPDAISSPVSSPAPTSTGTPVKSDNPNGQVVKTPEHTSTPFLSEMAAEFLEEALSIMEENSLNRAGVDWQALREEAYQMADGVTTLTDVYPAIRFSLGRLQDRHSFFLPAKEKEEIISGGRDSRNARPAGVLLGDKIGYIHLPRVLGSQDAIETYALNVQSLIRELDQSNPCGWIVDLTGNSGGNMWPMLAGIGPILGDGLAGSFVDAEGQYADWYYEDGKALVRKRGGGQVGETIEFELSEPAYVLTETLPPVAVLTSRETASSGEAIVVSFRGRPNTRSFGTATMGISTSNSEFELSDGSSLLLTTARFADREGQIYGGQIPPDVEVNASLEVRQHAVDWLLSLPECR